MLHIGNALALCILVASGIVTKKADAWSGAAVSPVVRSRANSYNYGRSRMGFVVRNASSSKEEEEEQYATLFEDIVLYTGDDPKRLIADRLEACTDPGFLRYLETTRDASQDDPEYGQALQDLLDMIDGEVVKAEQAGVKKEEEERIRKLEEEAESARLASSTVAVVEGGAEMSAADVLKKAYEIDKQVMVAEKLDEEQPDDFMRDAKSYCGLGGFSNDGNMRVGGS